VFENIECFSVTEITLNVLPLSDLGTYSTAFICNPNNIGDSIIDLQELSSKLLQDFPNTNITFYNSEINALLESEELFGEFTLADSQILELFFRVEVFNGCNNIGKLEIRVVSKPEVEDQVTVFCSNNDNILDAGNGFATYLWSTGETTQKIQINQEGMYWVEVSHGADCTGIININAVLSETIEIVDIVINDFRVENSVKIILRSFEGILKYSLDGGQTFITNNEFHNVAPGLYNLVVVRDDCNSISETILVGGYPSYFTPNGDGFHDGWQMFKPELFQNAEIKIYDRFGKLLKTMEAFESWDGIFNGKLVTPTDYWFSIKQNNKIVHGHFAMKL
ncbi:MAG: T9SS type B sorting domain-containing protein, partial [Bacteroidetes bacterium]|nr:T9SS type B sorting domain-containing protein [Bacteroidota bacterium]